MSDVRAPEAFGTPEAGQGLSASCERLFVLGHPVAHSKSPVMHNAAYRACGLRWEYGLADIACADEAECFVRSRAYVGLNVTTPHKPVALACADVADPSATLAGGANTLVNEGGRLHAYNTDGLGCVSYLRRVGVRVAGERIVVCGTGPTSLAIMAACAEEGAQVVVLGRDAARSREAVERWRQARLLLAAEGERPIAPLRGTVAGGSYGEGADLIREAALVCDATPLGMKAGDPAPFDVALLHEGQFVFDVVYGHGETALARAARKAGCAFRSGEGMLVGQAAASARLFMVGAGVSDVPSFACLFDVMAAAAGLSA